MKSFSFLVLFFWGMSLAADAKSVAKTPNNTIPPLPNSAQKVSQVTAKPTRVSNKRRVVRRQAAQPTKAPVPQKEHAIAKTLENQTKIQDDVRKQFADSSISLHYEGVTIHEVVREINTAYGINVVVDQGVEANVNIHLDKISMLDGLEALCVASGLELIHDGKIFHIRKISARTRNILNMNLKRMDLDVQNQDVKKFVRDFAQKTGLKLLASPKLEGMISGSWQNQVPLDGFLALMDAHSYEVKKKKGFYIVQPKNAANAKTRRRSKRGASNLEVEFKDGKLSLNLENASLDEVIKSISEETNLNIIFYGVIKESINAKIQNVGIDEAFSALLKGTKYTYILTKEGTILVGSKDPKTPAGKILTSYELYYLNHVKVDEIDKLLPKSIPKGSLTIIKEQNAVLISGTIAEIENIKKYLDLVDKSAPQVLLECIIVEVSRNKSDEYGVKQGNGQKSEVPSSIPFFFSQDGVSKEKWRGRFRTSYGILPAGVDLNLELSALESKNKAKVLAMPRITTLNGHKSTIRVTNTSYYERKSVSKDGVPLSDFRPIDDGITLDITPSITHSGEITIEIKPEIKTAKNISGSSDKPADISTRNLETTIRLQDRETIMLGGLIQTNEDRVREYVPILGSIPFLGYLFSYHSKTLRTTELVVFVTPHILATDGANFDVSETLKLMEERVEEDDLGKAIQNYGFQHSQVKEAPSDTAKEVLEQPIGK